MNERYQRETISDHITRITLPGDVFAYLAEGRDRAALIDTGFGIGSLKAYVEEVLQGKPYIVLLTHGHLDHAGGASEFEEVYMDPADLELARKHTEKQIRKDFLKQEVRDEDLAEPKKDGYLPLSDGQVFDLGGETLKIVSLHGHTRGSVGVLFEKERILLAGDACCSFTLLFGEEDSLS
ncbi:MAG: MBL fold metallo-hydrolase, partial [Erysipelotrichaceae bacterium]|nr:MBL fold metallo-hydrolase [Erysipelotrichaceae bacterium]